MKGSINAEIEKVIEKRPHLKEILGLYEKVAEFHNIASNLLCNASFEGIAYPSDLTDSIFETFSSIFDVSLENLEPLKEAMKFGRIDFTRLPMNELPSFSLPYHEDELASILFLISRPYFQRLKDSFKDDAKFGEDGECPVCNAKPSIASIDEENRRKLFCSFCGTSGYFKRIGCPVCLNADTSKLNIITIEDEKGFRVDTCDACGSYIKTIKAGLMDELNPDLADLISLHLDIIAQDKGYRRNSPNPLGMIMILNT